MNESNVKKRNRISWPEDRIFGFTDGVFAFAITLLVLNLINLPVRAGVQTLIPLLRANTATFASFALTFFIIACFWMSHTRLFAIIKSFDSTIVRLNNTLLFFVTTFPFIASVLGSRMGDEDAVILSPVALRR
ncbi:MAG: TMEM175 family protein [Candidatus Pacebacteria bacterium]|nr:TMEM175 family protein [Candidatus Paceibacterota bacterium]